MANDNSQEGHTGPSAEALEYGRAATAFFDDASTSPLDKVAGDAFHRPIKIHDTTENYMAETEERLELIKTVQRRAHEVDSSLDLNLMHLAMLMVIDLQQLRDWAVGDEDDTGLMLMCLKRVESFIKACLGKGYQHQRKVDKKASKRTLDATDDGESKRTKSADGTAIPVPPVDTAGSSRGETLSTGAGRDTASTEKEKVLDRDEKERDAALERDNGWCVFSEYAVPDVCHIIPHAINKSAERFKNAKEALHKFLLLFATDSSMNKDAKDLFFEYDAEGSPKLACSDKVWNLISMAGHIHRLFDRAYFGLKPIIRVQAKDKGKEGELSSICVEWRFLPKQLSKTLLKDGHLKNKPTQKMPLATCIINLESPGLLQCLHQELNNPEGERSMLGRGIPRAHRKDSRPIRSGMRFEIPARAEDVPKTMKALEISWLALRMASISGAADNIELLNDKPSEDWDKAITAFLVRNMKRAQEQYDDSEESAGEVDSVKDLGVPGDQTSKDEEDATGF